MFDALTVIKMNKAQRSIDAGNHAADVMKVLISRGGVGNVREGIRLLRRFSICIYKYII